MTAAEAAAREQAEAAAAAAVAAASVAAASERTKARSVARLSEGLPPGWVAAFDAKTQKPYYVHAATQASSWERPAPPAPVAPVLVVAPVAAPAPAPAASAADDGMDLEGLKEALAEGSLTQEEFDVLAADLAGEPVAVAALAVTAPPRMSAFKVGFPVLDQETAVSPPPSPTSERLSEEPQASPLAPVTAAKKEKALDEADDESDARVAAAAAAVWEACRAFALKDVKGALAAFTPFDSTGKSGVVGLGGLRAALAASGSYGVDAAVLSEGVLLALVAEAGLHDDAHDDAHPGTTRGAWDGQATVEYGAFVHALRREGPKRAVSEWVAAQQQLKQARRKDAADKAESGRRRVRGRRATWAYGAPRALRCRGCAAFAPKRTAARRSPASPATGRGGGT
jgi:hypothetical protein